MDVKCTCVGRAAHWVFTWACNQHPDGAADDPGTPESSTHVRSQQHLLSSRHAAASNSLYLPCCFPSVDDSVPAFLAGLASLITRTVCGFHGAISSIGTQFLVLPCPVLSTDGWPTVQTWWLHITPTYSLLVVWAEVGLCLPGTSAQGRPWLPLRHSGRVPPGPRCCESVP